MYVSLIEGQKDNHLMQGFFTPTATPQCSFILSANKRSPAFPAPQHGGFLAAPGTEQSAHLLTLEP